MSLTTPLLEKVQTKTYPEQSQLDPLLTMEGTVKAMNEYIAPLVIEGNADYIASMQQKLFLFRTDGRIEIFDMKTKFSTFLEGHSSSGQLRRLELIKDKNYLASSLDQNIILWNLEEQKEIARFATASNVNCFTTTHDSRYLVAGTSDGAYKVYIYDLEEMKETAVLGDHRNTISKVKISKDNKYIISVSFDSRIKIWDIQERKLVAELKGHESTIGSLELTEYGNRMVTYSEYDCSVKLWSIAERKEISVIKKSSLCKCFMLTNDNNYIFSSFDDKTIIIFDIQEQSQVMLETQGIIEDMKTLPDGKHFLVQYDNNKFTMGNIAERKEVATLKEYTGSINATHITDNGDMVVAFDDSIVRVGNLLIDRNPKSVSCEHDNGISAAEITQYGKYLVTADDQILKVGNMDSLENIGTLSRHEISVKGYL